MGSTLAAIILLHQASISSSTVTSTECCYYARRQAVTDYQPLECFYVSEECEGLYTSHCDSSTHHSHNGNHHSAQKIGSIGKNSGICRQREFAAACEQNQTATAEQHNNRCDGEPSQTAPIVFQRLPPGTQPSFPSVQVAFDYDDPFSPI